MSRNFLRTTLLDAILTFGLVNSSSPTPGLSQTKKANSDADISAIGHRNIGKDLNAYSIAREAELGKTLAIELERSSHLIDDPLVTKYLNRIAEILTQNSDARTSTRVQVIDSGNVDSLFLPGGFEYLNKGLLLKLNDEAELAGVIAHGIAHTALRHATREITQIELIGQVSVPWILLPAGWADSDLGIPLASLKFRRDAELDADFFGIQYVYKAGYDPESFGRFLERVWPGHSAFANTPKALSPFPPLSDRLQALKNEIAEILPERDSVIVSTAEFERAKERLRNWNQEERGSPPGALTLRRKRPETRHRSP